MIEAIQGLLQNDVFSGVVGGSFVASVLYTLREIPGKIYNFLIWRFTSRVTIHNDDAVFERLSEWLSALPYTKRARRVRVTTSHVEGGDSSLLMTPGIGRHLIRHSGSLLMIERSETESDRGLFRKETLTVHCLGGPSPIHRLVHDVRHVQAAGSVTPVFLFHGYWRRIASKKRRALESVVLPAEQKRRIVDDLKTFEASRERYEDLGLPYRRNYQFYGPPGTGKTSFALAVAGELGRPLYTLNLGSLAGDAALFEAVLSVPTEGIILIEDIDATDSTKKREDKEPAKPGEPKQESTQAITLSGLLNALDGAFSRDGRIVIMTTNHPEKLDPALLRAGRSDLRECFDWFGRAEAMELCARFGVDFDSMDMTLPVSPSWLQEQLKRASIG